MVPRGMRLPTPTLDTTTLSRELFIPGTFSTDVMPAPLMIDDWLPLAAVARSTTRPMVSNRLRIDGDGVTSTLLLLFVLLFPACNLLAVELSDTSQ